MAEEQQPSSLGLNDFAPAKLIKNRISMVGLALAVVALANIIFLFLVDMVSTQASPYIGILAYMIMPGLLVLGLVLMVGGMMVERRRRARGVPTQLASALDLNKPSPAQFGGVRSELRRDVRDAERDRELQSLRIH